LKSFEVRELQVNLHPSVDTLELYSLGHLSEAQVPPIEEHLLTCVGCQDRLTEVDAYIASMKVVCRDSIRVEPAGSSAPGFFARLFQVPMPVWVGAAAVIMLATAIPVLRQPANTSDETEVRLIANRGAEFAVKAHGNLRLNFSSSQLASSYPSYNFVLVDHSGRELWKTTLPHTPDISVRLPMSLDIGQYWIRVTGPKGEAAGEFSLELH
jgi:hypothetical protein